MPHSLNRNTQCLVRHQVVHRRRHQRVFRSCMLMPPSRTRTTCLRSNIAPRLAGENVQHIDMLCMSHSVCLYAVRSRQLGGERCCSSGMSYGFLKEASTCRTETPFDVAFDEPLGA